MTLRKARTKQAPKHPTTLDPERLTVADLAALMAQASGLDFTEDAILDMARQGAPVNPDGSISLVAFAAWLAHALEAARRGR